MSETRSRPLIQVDDHFRLPELHRSKTRDGMNVFMAAARSALDALRHRNRAIHDPEINQVRVLGLLEEMISSAESCC
jgi:hypothetical protein